MTKEKESMATRHWQEEGNKQKIEDIEAGTEI